MLGWAPWHRPCLSRVGCGCVLCGALASLACLVFLRLCSCVLSLTRLVPVPYFHADWCPCDSWEDSSWRGAGRTLGFLTSSCFSLPLES